MIDETSRDLMRAAEESHRLKKRQLLENEGKKEDALDILKLAELQGGDGEAIRQARAEILGEGERLEVDPRTGEVILPSVQSEDLYVPNRFQQFMRTGLGQTALTIFQMIPSPIGVGPGDAITGANAIYISQGLIRHGEGRDLFTGERADWGDAIANAVATVIPVAPGTVLVGIYHGARDAWNHWRSGEKGDALASVAGAAIKARAVHGAVKAARGGGPPTPPSAPRPPTRG